ncbi:peptidase, C39 family [Prevotella denticola CRIS 18C-A]|uniref:Peptidase, C39 family n=1 Tax=Prevotella denticola CRIS 18C-A TaxID=944557 RepID=F0H6W5_9BACT|nr:peptidase, C39 family [Prevotella denticola CRIS 18C-A]
MDRIYLIKELSFLLKVANVKFNRSLLIKELLSDPCYPSLVSISKALSFFGIENESYIVDVKHLPSLKNVIVHTTDENGHFYVLKGCSKDDVHLYDGTDKTTSKSEFLSVWDGVTLKMSRVHQDYSPSHNHTLGIFLATLFLLAISSITILQGKMIQALFFLNIIGLALAGSLLKKQMYNYDTVPFCMKGTIFDCEYVSARNPFRRWIPFDLPVLGLFFFIFCMSYLMLTQHTNFIFWAVNFVAVIIMLILTCYQLLVIRKYCIYCLSITVILMIKIFLLKPSSAPISLITLSNLICAFSLAFLLSIIIYKFAYVDSSLDEKEIELLRLKRNKRVLSECFSKKHVENSISDMMEFGNKNANIVITTFISLRCTHCRKVVSDIINLLAHFPNRFLWRVAIEGVYHPAMPENVFAKVNARQLNLLRLYQQDKKQCMKALGGWNIMKKNKNDTCLIVAYRHQLEMIKEENISHYPHIWVNDYIFPKEYSIKDLQCIQNEIIQLG